MAGDQQKFQVAMTHAERFSQQQNWAEAIKAYRFALAEFPNNEAAIVGFGRASLFSGQTQFAERAFQQALKINPTNYEALTYLGEIQEQAGQVDAAAETYLRVGNIYSSRMDIEAALDFWRRTISLVPHHIEAHRRLVEGLVQQEKPRLAARELLALAGALQARDQLDEAAQQIQAIEQLTPGDPGIAAAYEALQSGSAIDPEMISETPPESARSFDDAFDSYGDDSFDDDLFSLDEGAEPEEAPKKGLIESLQQQALTELAGSVFEDSDNPEHTMLIVQAIDMQG
ncbi:MAG: tetratricopeptide repeat protein, partial [Anaerolineae bacterium]|nr:tetratricopeptide repeat protein [Anaerolineae bacterium]